MKLKVIIPVGDVPEGETVTKVAGTKKYVVRDALTLYNPVGDRQELKAADGCRILSYEGSATAIPSESEVVWRTTLADLERIYEGEDK